MKKLICYISQIGIVENDSAALKMQKNFLVYLAVFMSCGGLIWGGTALSHGLVSSSLIPFLYVLLSTINMLVFSRKKRFGITRSIQILLSLLLPFAFQASLGGFASSGAMMLWSVLALVASVTIQDLYEAMLWFFLFMSMTIMSVALDSIFLVYKPEILPDFSIIFLALNILLIVGIVFGLVAFYVSKKVSIQMQLLKELKVLSEQYKKQRSILHKQKLAYEIMLGKNERIKQSKEDLRKTLDEQIHTNQRLRRELSIADTSTSR